MDVLDLLRAEGPAGDHADALMLYGRLIGSWKVTAEWFSPEGGVRHASGSWHFAWVLGGMAVQDVLFADGAALAAYGTTLRCYDPHSDCWHVTWMQPSSGEFVSLVGRARDGDIVQDSLPAPGEPPRRWTFVDVSPDSFVWLGEVRRTVARRGSSSSACGRGVLDVLARATFAVAARRDSRCGG